MTYSKSCIWGLIGVLGLLTACNGSQAASEKYQALVLETLRGDPLADTGLGQIIAETIGDLGCEGVDCISVLRFQYLRDQASERQITVADYQGQLCTATKIQPPRSHKDQHDLLCTKLAALFKALDAIKTNSNNALRLLGPSGPGSSVTDALVGEFSNRLARESRNILEIQRKLREIEWLRSVL